MEKGRSKPFRLVNGRVSQPFGLERRPSKLHFKSFHPKWTSELSSMEEKLRGWDFWRSIGSPRP